MIQKRAKSQYGLQTANQQAFYWRNCHIMTSSPVSANLCAHLSKMNILHMSMAEIMKWLKKIICKSFTSELVLWIKCHLLHPLNTKNCQNVSHHQKCYKCNFYNVWYWKVLSYIYRYYIILYFCYWRVSIILLIMFGLICNNHYGCIFFMFGVHQKQHKQNGVH